MGESGERGPLGAFIRDRAHAKLDDVMDRYERGEPLWISWNYGWQTPEHAASMEITIREPRL